MSTIAESVTVNRVRLESIDIVRGVILGLDGAGSRTGLLRRSRRASHIDQATKALFFTRWITHFCAPVFFVLTALAPICRYAEIQTRVIAISVHSRPVADLSRRGGDPLFRLAT
jgi:hypothetical protein